MSIFRWTRVLRRTSLVALGLLLWAACADGPRPVHAGSDTCGLCYMTISQEAFAAQLLTDRGRSYMYDSVECLAESVHHEEPVARDNIRSLWVTDFADPGVWVVAQEAYYLRSDQLRSPMGMGLSAYSTRALAQDHQAEFGGEILDWDGVLRLVADDAAQAARHTHAH